MRRKYTLHVLLAAILLTFLNITIEIQAQSSGSISGTITDKSTGEVLIGANVLVTNTITGASTDIDGYYTVKNLPAGIYSLKISFISYASKIVENVVVNPGKDTHLNVTLDPSSTELSEVVVTGDLLQTSESAVLKYRKTSANIVDGMSAELISKNNSSDGTDVLERMTGINISEGKYAYVRGVGDRYNSTLLNGATVPGTDPEKKSFSYDLVPAALIENVLTQKTFTPDKPADFTGGLVEIKTIEFPSKFFLDISSTAGYNSKTTGNDFYTYNGGGKDFLGYDDGTRGMPPDISGTKVVRGNYSDQALTDITKSFNNNWGTSVTKAPINTSYKLNIGDKQKLGDNTLGYVGSLNYSNSTETKGLDRSFYDNTGARYDYQGATGTRSVSWGGMLNLSYKFGGTNKVSFKNVYNQNADDVTSRYNGDYRYADQYRDITIMNYVSRSLLANQLLGEHLIPSLNGLLINWNLSYSQSKRNEPDTRRAVYARNLSDGDAAPLTFLLDKSLATRYYGNLNDHNYNGNIDFTIKLFEDPNLPKLKTGYFIDRKQRDFSARSFGFKNIAGGNAAYEQQVLQGPVEQIFTPGNINSTFIRVDEATQLSDSYSSEQMIHAGFLMFDTQLLDQLRVAAGARYEFSTQKLNSFDLRGVPVHVNEKYHDLLPSVNLTYLLTEWINIRAAYGTTLACPEFRELAPFSYFDFINNELVRGNPDLKRTLINNYDLRAEIFPGAGELIAVGLFYKHFNNPIEEVLQAAANEPIRSYENAHKAENYGLEIELRQNLNSYSDLLNNFSFIGNATFIKSKVELNNNGYQQSSRPLQGQAPYIFNLGLYYDNLDLGIQSSIIYNKTGERIAIVGARDLGNIMESPVDMVDFSVSKNLYDHLTVRLSVKDLFNQDRVLIQQSPIGDRVSEVERAGRNVNVSLSLNL